MKRFYDKANWYRHRLAAISAPEVFHRLGEAVRKHMGRTRQAPEPHDYGPIPPIPGFRQSIENGAVSEKLLSSWREALTRAKNGEFSFLNLKWPETQRDPRWHRDPVTAKFWSQDAPSFRIDYRHNPDMGDVKYVWELNRLQYLQPIAALAFRAKDKDAADFCLEEIESWIENNVPGHGINWASGIEVALRIVSILVVTTFTDEHVTESLRGKIWANLHAHALWLERHPSRFSSSNNHRAAEGLGLFLLGSVCPQLPRAEQWKMEGWAILEDAARRLILPDGTGAEQALAYTAFTLEMLLLGLHVARAGSVNVSEAYIERIMRGGEFLRWLTTADGRQPQIGDDDNGCVIGPYPGDGGYISSILGCIAAMTQRGELTPPNFLPSLRHILLGIPPGKKPGPQGVRYFENGGMTIGRHTINGRKILVAFDHGPLGYLSIAAHGHADSLSIWLHIDDQPVFVDAGTYLYHSGGSWRDYFRGTTAHNTLNLGGRNTSMPAGAFNWSHKARVTVREQKTESDSWSVEAEHDGYMKRFGLLHRRRVSLHPEMGFSISDQLINAGAADVRVNFLLHPSLSAQLKNNGVEIRKGGKLLLYIENKGPLKAEVIPPGLPESGWYSPSFGLKQQTVRVAFTGILAPWKKSVLKFTIGAAPKAAARPRKPRRKP